MYTQCPACLTTFMVTPAQLAARAGLVRCGICSAIFHAEQRRLQTPAQGVPPPQMPPPGTAERRRAGQDRRTSVRRHHDRLQPAPFLSPVEEADFPIVTDLDMRSRPRPRLHAALWGLGNLVLLLVLAGQLVYLYRDALAANPAWRPWVAQFCGYARCALRPLQDVAAIELLQTTVAPHPDYANALRIRATMINRASFAQNFPDMEVSLTDSNGGVIARRTFTAAEYLPAPATGLMAPNVVVATLLDVTNPDARAVGYELRLVAPDNRSGRPAAGPHSLLSDIPMR
jgi:predicted Zn finger-like uncharacterized protein